MASENEAIVRRNIDEAWNGGRLEVLDETVADQYARARIRLPNPSMVEPSSRRRSGATATPSPTSTSRSRTWSARATL